MERDARKARTPARGGKAAKLKYRQGRMLCREFHPLTAREDAAAGNFIQHQRGEEDAATILAAVPRPEPGLGEPARSGGDPGPLRLHPGRCPRSPLPRQGGFPVPRPPCGLGRAAGRGREEGPGAAGASCRRPRRGRAERGGSSARPGPAERRSRAEPNFPGGSPIHTRTRIYRYI